MRFGAIASARPVALFTLVASLYVLAFPYHPGLRSPNELCRLWQSRALVEFGDLSLNRVLARYGPVGDLSVREGRYYPSKAPLLSLAGAPIYAALRLYSVPVSEVAQVFWSRLLLTIAPTLLLLVLLRRFLAAYVDAVTADLATAVYAVGTLAFSYSLLFMSHQTTAVLIFASFFALWRTGRGDWKAWKGYVIVGASAGAAIAAEYTAALALPGLVLFALLDSPALRDAGQPLRTRLGGLLRAALLSIAGALPFIVALMAYHQAAFGHVLHSGYKYLADAAYQPWHLGGFLGIRTPDPRAFALSLFSPLRGLFALSPFLLLGLAGLGLLRRAHRALFWAKLLQVLLYAYFTSSFAYDSWGWTTGPRHLTPLVVFLILPAALCVARVRRAQSHEGMLARGAAAALGATSVLVTGALSFVNYIPDSVSSPLFGLALPLFRQGYLPPSALSFVGVENPWAALPLLVGLCALAAWIVSMTFAGPEQVPSPRSQHPAQLGLVLTLIIHLGLLAATTRHDSADTGAIEHLKSVWLVLP